MPTVLIINDDPDFLEALAQVLELEDYAVVCATSCEEALRLAVTCGPQVIVSDFRMRGADGVALLEELRERKLCTDVPKFLLSGSNAAEIRRRLQTARLDVPVLSKADSVDRLVRAIRASAPPPEGAATRN
jgi:two-component system KDP operon response regulator KdpE